MKIANCDVVIMDDSVAEIEFEDKEREEQPAEKMTGKVATMMKTMAISIKRLGRRRKRLLTMAKPLRQWLIVTYEQVLALVRQAFKMVTNLEQMGGSNLSSDTNVRDMIENTRIWLVDQIGKHFPRERHGYLLKH